jgi:hypothetical protein
LNSLDLNKYNNLISHTYKLYNTITIMAKKYKTENGKLLKAITFDYYGKPTGWLDVTPKR